MAKAEWSESSSWNCAGKWKPRYSKLYSFRNSRITSHIEVPESPRVSFMNQEFDRSSLVERYRAPSVIDELLSPRLGSRHSSPAVHLSRTQSDDLGGHETKLLDMVRAHNRKASQESATQPLELGEDNVSDDLFDESCVHGLSMRNTERSISRSRVSRASARRDMDIPSILAFTTTTPAPKTHLEIPEFQMAKIPQQEQVPRWSIRRSMCPVCSQKWRDRSSIRNVKYSGLKRNSSQELLSVIAPARLRTSITLRYVPRPALAAVDEEAAGGLRSTGASWQLTRARRFRAPKPQVPPPEATAPPSATAPLARKDLDTRVSRFLTDVEVPILDVL